MAIARYREYAPCASLRESVRAFFSFAPPGAAEPDLAPVTREVCFAPGDSFCSPAFADGHLSLVFNFSTACHPDGLWRAHGSRPRGDVIGAMSGVGSSSLGARANMFGVYFRAARAHHFLPVPARELTNRVAPLEELWGPAAADLAIELNEARSETARIRVFESALLDRLAAARAAHSAIDLPGLTAWVLRRRGRISVERLADAGGVSRQYLTRVFGDSVGVAPKLYCRLARFQSGLVYAGSGARVNWAQAALDLGYADQSHMIAEFRQFSSLTPETLARGRWFHPFIERARRP